MYNTEDVKEERTLDEILEKTTEYDIFCYYGKQKFKLNHVTNSPLREDHHPSFGIFKGKNGVIMYKDYATGDSGDCIKFVRELYSISYRDALQKIWTDLIENKFKATAEGRTVKKSEIKHTTKRIAIKRRNFTDNDDKYWGQYKIDREMLKFYNVFPIKLFWINDIQSPFSYSNDDPMYAYKMYNAFKIYRPLTKIRANKWRSNCTQYDMQGMEQLPYEGDLLIITSSLKDVMVLKRFELLSVAPHSETPDLPKEVVYELKKRFKRLVIFYDNDSPGIKAANALKDKYGFETIHIPTEYKVKDISDFIAKYGIMKTRKLLKELL